MVCPHHAVTRVDSCAFNDWKNVALHALTRNVRTMARLASRNLVDLVEEDDSRVLNAFDRCTRNLVHVDETLFLFLHQVLHRLIDPHFASLRATLKQVSQHVFHVDAHLFDALWTSKLDHGKVFLSDFQLNEPIVELAAAQLRAQLFACSLKLFVTRGTVEFGGLFFLTRVGVEIVKTRGRTRRWQQQVENTFLDVQFRLLGDLFALVLPRHLDRDFSEVTDHTLDIATYVSNLSKLRSFNFQKRRVGHAREPASDLRFTDAR